MNDLIWWGITLLVCIFLITSEIRLYIRKKRNQLTAQDIENITFNLIPVAITILIICKILSFFGIRLKLSEGKS